MALDVYHQVKVVVSHKELTDAVVVEDQGIIRTSSAAIAQYLRQNHLIPYCDEAIMGGADGDHLKVRLLEGNPHFLIITAWVKDELCENYKPKMVDVHGAPR